MKNRKKTWAILSIIIICFYFLPAYLAPAETLKGQYLGCKKPGLTPEIFSPDVVSADKNELNAAFSPDGQELFFSIFTPQRIYILMVMKQENGQWTMPQTAPFSGKYSDVDPSFSPDGKTLFFSSSRPLPGKKGPFYMDIWIVEKSGSRWSEPYNAGSLINSDLGEVHPVLTRKGNLYYASARPGGKGGKDIYRSRMVKGKFSKPENLGDAVNSSYGDSDCYISPGEDFLIFCSTRPGGRGRGDLYISFRKKDGSFTNAKNMGDPINTPENEYAPMGSPDGKYFFFTRSGPSQKGGGDVYWVDAKIIEQYRDPSFPVLKGKYLGQKPPGLTPGIFAPGIVSIPGRSEINSIFSPDYQEFYFSVRKPDGGYKIVVMKRVNNRWTAPRTASFSGTYSEADPFFSYDGSTLYYASKRPIPNVGPPHDIWGVKRTKTGWSEPFNPGPPINSKANEVYPALTRDGTMYFVSNREGSLGGRDIYRSTWKNGRFTEAENLGGTISTTYDEGDVYISPDESYIIFVSRGRPDTFGSGDLYISFKKPDGSWIPAKNMGGKINSTHYDFCPVISPDGKYFFYSKAGDVYWVSSKIIEQFKPIHTKK